MYDREEHFSMACVLYLPRVAGIDIPLPFISSECPQHFFKTSKLGPQEFQERQTKSVPEERLSGAYFTRNVDTHIGVFPQSWNLGNN